MLFSLVSISSLSSEANIQNRHSTKQSSYEAHRLHCYAVSEKRKRSILFDNCSCACKRKDLIHKLIMHVKTKEADLLKITMLMSSTVHRWGFEGRCICRVASYSKQLLFLVYLLFLLTIYFEIFSCCSYSCYKFMQEITWHFSTK